MGVPSFLIYARQTWTNAVQAPQLSGKLALQEKLNELIGAAVSVVSEVCETSAWAL